MDSVSQMALGAAVGVAVMGRRTAFWKAALWGGIVGALPDLDVMIDHGDPVSNMTLHRAQTHAFFWQTLATPPIAAGIAAIHRRADGFSRTFPRWAAAVWLILVTHSLLDVLTVYGTQIALPFSDHPYGIGSIFVIDPLYTLPLLVGLAAAAGSRSRSRLRRNHAGLLLSTLYLAWSLAAQAHVTGVVREQLASEGGDPIERVLVTPTPFNTVLWRVLVMRGGTYDEGFHSLLDGGRPIRFDTFERGADLYRQTRDQWAVARIAWFSRGFFRMSERDHDVTITDLRMGQEPFHFFSFRVAATRAGAPAPVPPEQVGSRSGLDIGGFLRWLGPRIGGADIAPPRDPVR